MPTPEERMSGEYDAFYRATGELIREWAELELTFTFILSNLLGIDQFRSRVILGSLRSFESKRRIILQLSSTFAEDDLDKRIAFLMDRARKLSRNRNMLAHQLGGVASRTNQLVFISDTVDQESDTNFLTERIIDINTIRKWNDDIKSLRSEILDVCRSGLRVYAEPKFNRNLSTDGEEAKK